MKYLAVLFMLFASLANAQGVRIVDLPTLSSPPSTFMMPGAATSGADVKTITLADVATSVASSGPMTTAMAGKMNAPAGTTSQYVRGDGSLATFPSIPATPSINDSPGRSLVTTTSSTGFQISSTRLARVCYEGSFSTTSTIGGPASASVFLETADTNSTTPGDWTTKAQQTYSNTITLAVVLNQQQSNNWTMCRDIPAGKYVRIRSGSISGTASASINSQQQETLY